MALASHVTQASALLSASHFLSLRIDRLTQVLETVVLNCTCMLPFLLIQQTQMAFPTVV